MGGQELCVARICPPKFLCGLLTTAAALLFLANGGIVGLQLPTLLQDAGSFIQKCLDNESSTSLKGKQLVYRMQMEKYVSLDGHLEKILCSFTVCIDINITDPNLATWPAFSYDVNSSSEDFRKEELALSMNKSTLQVFILGSVVEVRQDLPAFTMHRLCCIWDGTKRLLEIFHHGSKLKSAIVHNMTHQCLRPGGTLALGRLHKNRDGALVPEPSFTLSGNLYYFQLWASVRDQQKMTRCDRGDVISWQDSYWHLNGIRTVSSHEQHCGKEEVTPTLASTTPESSAAEIFYKIKMESSMFYPSLETFDYYDAMDLLRKVFDEKLQNFTFVITNIQIKLNPKRSIAQRGLPVRSKYLSPGFASCEPKRGTGMTFQSYSSQLIIRITSKENKDEIKSKLHEHLEGSCEIFVYSVCVEVETISDFDPKMCLEDVIQTKYKGIFQWPETGPVNVAEVPCPNNRTVSAKRTCSISIEDEKAHWRRQNVTSCQLLDKLPDNIISLENVNITMDNAENLVDHILSLLNSSTWSPAVVEVLVNKLTAIANCEEVSSTLAQKSLQIIDAFMTIEANDHLQGKLNSILQLTEQIGFKMSFNGRNSSIVMPKLALALLRPDPVTFQGIAFAVMSYDSKTDPELKIRQAPFTTATVAVFLPGLLREFLKVQSFEPENHTEIQFSFFGTTSLFQDSSFEDTKLNSYVVGASIEDISIRNLKEPVNVILKHLEPNVNNASVHCVFWDFSKNGGSGGWSTSGCESVYTDTNYTICNCSHLTHFGVLLDIFQNPVENEADNWNLTLISNVGCGISSIFLGLALIIYLSIDKLRRDHPSRILINLCFALLMLNLTFLLDPWLSSFQKRGLCISVGAVLHYFLLASFTWMGLEAIHMYYALVQVFNIYFTHYILKLSVVGWGIPAAIVATVLAISRDIYGTEPVSRSAEPLESFCWIRHKTTFYISVVAYFCLVFLVNASIFVTVLLQIQAMKAKNRFEEGSWGQDLLRNMKQVASLSFLLGLTWGFAFFATGPVQVFFLYLFALCNTFQGFFIFVFHCLMKENVRKQCQIHFCCGRFRLSYSQWATSATSLAYPPMKNLERKLSFLSLKSQKSCATNSTSNGSGSLAGSIPDIGVKVDQTWHSPGRGSLTHQEASFPHVRRIS